MLFLEKTGDCRSMRPITCAKRFNILSNKDWSAFFVLLLILVGALLVRLYDLDLMPLNVDEASDTIGGIEKIKAGKAESFFNIPISTDRGKIPVLFNLFALISSRFFVNPILIARVPAVIFGTLTVLLAYVFAKRLYDTKTGLLSALFLAFLPWHVIMSRIGLKIILVPFFGILIFYLLYAGIKEKKTALFLFSFFILGVGSFYTYPSAVIFLPIFIISFFILKGKQDWPPSRILFIGVLLFLLLIFPLFVLSARGVNFWDAQSYHSFFRGDNLNALDFHSIFKNFILNMLRCSNLLFFSSRPIDLLAPSMRYPLFLSNLFFPVFLLPLIYACWKRTKSDLIMLIWLILSLLLTSFVMGDGISAQYLFIILPVPIVLIARFLMDMMSCSTSRKTISRATAIVVSLLIVGCSLNALVSYFREAPDSKEEWIKSSFGSEEAVKYLFEDNTSQNYKVITDDRMVLEAYLQYYINIFEREDMPGDIKKHFVRRGIIEQCAKKEDLVNLEKKWLEESDVIYYFLWSSKTRGSGGNLWRSEFRRFIDIFKKVHPREKPVKEIYYPDGHVAIEVFKIYRDQRLATAL